MSYEVTVKKVSENQCGTGNVDDCTQSDSKVWETVQYPTGTDILLVKNSEE